MFSWNDYPIEILRPLLQGSVGKLQLSTVAEAVLNYAQKCPKEQTQSLFSLAGQMLLAVWESDPLNASAASNVLQLHRIHPVCSAQMIAFIQLISKTSLPAEVQEYQRIMSLADRAPAMQYVEAKTKADPQNIFWLRSSILLGLSEAKFAWLERWLLNSSAVAKPLQQGFIGDTNFAMGNYEKAAKHYMIALRAFPSLVWRERLGDALYECGSKDAALDQWDMVLAQRPWHTSLLLKRFDVKHGRDLPGELPEGQGAILFYTWNKADCLNTALASVAASDIGDARIIVFDNGSTDTTPDVINAWQDKLGARMHTFRAPCNIGAPAARNWLLAMPETKDCDWVAYLDDDAEVPTDWLRRLGAAMKAYPNHPVYGCRVVNHDNQLITQSADFHLIEGGVLGSMQGGENGAEPGHIQRFSISNIQGEGFDFNNFSFVRPCASVTGCCHLFRREALDAVGGFDLRFSPSQFDDLEHDIRLALQGKWPIYQGHLRVKHMRQSGNSAATNVVSRMSIWANMFKLQTKYTHEEYEIIRLTEHELLLQDVMQKAAQG